jgi:adenylate cyclase
MSLFNELKRRNVFRVAVAYLVSAWIIAQVADLVLNNIEAPPWLIQSLLLVLGLGFVVALVISWAYELTPEGIKKEEDVVRDDSATNITAKKLDYITLVAAIVVLGLFAYQQMNPAIISQIKQEQVSNPAKDKNTLAKTIQKEISEASIAVLPFADLSPAGDQEYFSDGIAEEILNVLVRVDSLKVASRTSAFGFKGQEALGIPLIAEKLRVRHILEGSVRKSGDMVRITAQLIDAQTDQHLWSQTYDRTLNAENIFIIQDEISSEIVKALRSKLKIDIGEVQGVKINTDNLDAYELYLKARQKFFARSAENIPEIIELAKRATDLDPNFAEAWAGLAAAYAVATSWGVAGDDHIENSNTAAEKAISIDSNSSLAYAVLQSNLHSFIPMNFEKAFEYSNKALSLDPNNSTALLWRGIDELALGYFDRADARFKKCLEIDPAYQNCKRYMAVSKLYAGKTQQAFALFDEGMAAGATSQIIAFQLALFANGDHQAGLYLGILITIVFDGILEGINYTDLSFRRWTDPNFDFEQELTLLSAKIKADTGQEFNWSEHSSAAIIAYLFKQYDKITPVYHFRLWWVRADPDFMNSPHRKRLMREIGIYDYWHKHGYPPQCRAVGDDDFECD